MKLDTVDCCFVTNYICRMGIYSLEAGDVFYNLYDLDRRVSKKDKENLRLKVTTKAGQSYVGDFRRIPDDFNSCDEHNGLAQPDLYFNRYKKLFLKQEGTKETPSVVTCFEEPLIATIEVVTKDTPCNLHTHDMMDENRGSSYADWSKRDRNTYGFHGSWKNGSGVSESNSETHYFTNMTIVRNSFVEVANVVKYTKHHTKPNAFGNLETTYVFIAKAIHRLDFFDKFNMYHETCGAAALAMLGTFQETLKKAFSNRPWDFYVGYFEDAILCAIDDLHAKFFPISNDVEVVKKRWQPDEEEMHKLYLKYSKYIDKGYTRLR